MIKCNVTVCGTIGREAASRTGKEGKTFLSFPLRVAIQGKDGQSETVEIGVSRDGGQDEAAGYRKGSRIEATGTMYLKRRGERLYFNLFADRIVPAAADAADAIEGEMSFRGKAGKNIEERKDKNGKPLHGVLGVQRGEDGRRVRVPVGAVPVLRPRARRVVAARSAGRGQGCDERGGTQRKTRPVVPGGRARAVCRGTG